MPNDRLAARRRTNKRILIVLGALLGVLVLCGVIGAVFGEDQDDGPDEQRTTTVSAGPSSLAAPSATGVPAEPSTTEISAPPTTPARPVSDARCAPASENLVALVADGLTTEGYKLTNGTVISEGGTTYFGATIVDAAGKMRERSDVWIIRDGAVYASTGGARNNTIHPKASDALGISPGDPNVAAVDGCVVDATR